METEKIVKLLNFSIEFIQKEIDKLNLEYPNYNFHILHEDIDVFNDVFYFNEQQSIGFILCYEKNEKRKFKDFVIPVEINNNEPDKENLKIKIKNVFSQIEVD